MHNSQAKRRIRRKLKNFNSWQWCGAKNPEVWFGWLGKYLRIKNKGHRIVEYNYEDIREDTN